MSIIINEYDPQWPILFAAEKQLVQETIGEHIIDFQHIGSTSVPGLAAKNKIDMMASIRKLDDVPTLITPRLQALGYLYQDAQEKAQPWVRFFCKPDPSGLEYFLYLCEHQAPDWEGYWYMHLSIRDYLRAYPEEAASYGQFKKLIAGHFQSDWQSYHRCKRPFIETMIERGYRAKEAGLI